VIEPGLRMVFLLLAVVLAILGSIPRVASPISLQGLALAALAAAFLFA
jgi:hypothetical protein